jgi:flagellar protein FlgJ
MIDVIAPVAAVLPTTPAVRPTKAADAAKQFEALLIGQMLRSARESAWDDRDDSSRALMLDVADQQFAQVLANNGGLGMARLIVKGLEPPSRPIPSAP